MCHTRERAAGRAQMLDPDSANKDFGWKVETLTVNKPTTKPNRPPTDDKGSTPACSTCTSAARRAGATRASGVVAAIVAATGGVPRAPPAEPRARSCS